ncbi:MAG: nitrilase-related carbon-nitrogen hydrolase [Promethearchaeota archaeon]
MIEGENLQSILDQAVKEEKEYNWIAAANLYENALNLMVLDDNISKKGEICKRLGYSSSRSANQAESAIQYKDFINLAKEAYEKAADCFRDAQKKALELECRAEVYHNSAIIAKTKKQAREEFEKSIEFFKMTSEVFSDDGDQYSVARVLARAARTSWLLVTNCRQHDDVIRYKKSGIAISEKALKIAMEVKNLEAIEESIVNLGFIKYAFDLWTGPFSFNGQTKYEFESILLTMEEILLLTEDCNNYEILARIYFIYANAIFHLATRFTEGVKEQKQYFDKGFHFVEKSLELARTIKDKLLLVRIIFWLNYFTSLVGKYKLIQKRIVGDVKEVEKIGVIFEFSNTLGYYYCYSLPAIYYGTFARRSFISLEQRKLFTIKGMEYVKKLIDHASFGPFLLMHYQFLSYFYSQLVLFSSEKEEQYKFSQEMLNFAIKAKEMGEKYEGGMARSAGYSSLYRAYKTLADISKTKEEKIKMLSAAINEAENNLKFIVESRRFIITYRIRLGLLYEELSILTADKGILNQAKTIFLDLIKETSEWGFPYHTASIYEYLAHIEDRLGNHSISAQYYEKSEKAHEISLEKIKYKPLKHKISDRIEYIRAWSLIERAKSFHKMEDHIKAKMHYEQASQKLAELKSFRYEAKYYIAWSMLEEAELFSKKEEHEKAIQFYEETANKFNEAIEDLKFNKQKSKDKTQLDRIVDLIKIAKLRISYCSARKNLEEGKLLAKTGDNLIAADKFSSAASQFVSICESFKNEKEKAELEAVYYLCKAWESMELAEKYQDAKRFSNSADLFKKAGELYTESKLKLLASGNSNICLALEFGCNFDQTIDQTLRAQLYPKIKLMLRNATESYRKGGFDKAADWAFATSSYFDAAWNIIQADIETDLQKKTQLLDLGSNLLKSTAELFAKAGYISKEKEILIHVEMVKKEARIIISALNTMSKPDIARSTTGIIAPACPLETSVSPNLGDIRQISEDIEKSKEEIVSSVKKYQLINKDILLEHPELQKNQFKVGIAQIGISKSGDIMTELFEVKKNGLLGIKSQNINDIKTQVKDLIQQAKDVGISLLIFPEMTIDLNYKNVLDELLELSKSYGIYIVPGSYHDESTEKNISIMISPKGIIWSQEKHIPAIIHFGKEKFKEAIQTGSPPRKTIVCNTEYGRIAITICRDFLDMDLRVELKNHEPPVDIIINPAFTPVTADFKAAHFDARRSIFAYCFFANVAEYGESFIHTPEKDRTERILPSQQEGLIYKDIDLFKLRSERKKWEKEQLKERQFIQSTRT